MTEITGSTRLAAVIGSPVRHSLSPALHNAGFEAGGVDWRFLAFDVPAGEAARAVSAMKTLGIGGLAVTMPHKVDVATAVDEVDPASAALGAVNTVVLRPDGSTFGVSTDGAGFVASLHESGIAVDGVAAVVLGAGGAARSIAQALDRSGARRITIVNRTQGTARQLVELGDAIEVGHESAIDGASLLVNATSVGMGSSELPIDPARLRSDLVVADIVYHPLETTLLAAARACGAATVDGLGMLVHQAVLQQQVWTGVRPDPVAMRAAALAELSARNRL